LLNACKCQLFQPAQDRLCASPAFAGKRMSPGLDILRCNRSLGWWPVFSGFSGKPKERCRAQLQPMRATGVVARNSLDPGGDGWTFDAYIRHPGHR
jgi:hypothetical protein